MTLPNSTDEVHLTARPFLSGSLEFAADSLAHIVPAALDPLRQLFTAQCTLVHMRGLGIACRPSVRRSVRPSVTLVDCDHIGWKSRKLITRATSPTPSLFVAKRRSA